MKFQTMLAKRYIFAQKRHSILTVCSIIVALTFMSMLFTGFSTIYTSKRNIEYDKTPYHFLVKSVTKEQGEILASAENIESCVLKENSQKGTYSAELMLKKFIKDEDVVLKNAFEKAGLLTDDENVFKESKTSIAMAEVDRCVFMHCEASMLMIYDFVGVMAWYTVACVFSLFFVFVIILILAMRLVIDTAFEISSKERERQFGVLQSIGATPSQVVKIINTEGSILSLIGIPIGILCGNLVAYIAYKIVLSSELLEAFFTPEDIERLVKFSINPVLMVISAITGYFWVWLSAYSTGMRIIKMSPMQAITSRSNTVKKVKKHSVYGLFFGWLGKLAARNARRSKKRFWITVVSLTVSIILFSNCSYAIDSFIKTYEAYLFEEGIDFDFSILSEEKVFGEKGYRNTINELENTGYFENVCFDYGVSGYHSMSKSNESKSYDKKNNLNFNISYLNETAYNKLFNGKPPISYNDLAESGEFIMLEIEEKHSEPAKWDKIEKLQKLDEIPLTLNIWENISVAEYKTLPVESREKCSKITADNDRNKIIGYRMTKKVPQTFKVNCRYPREDSKTHCDDGEMQFIELVGTCTHLEQARGILKNNSIFAIECTLVNKDVYYDAVNYIKNHRYLTLEFDVFDMNYKNSSSFALAKIIILFVSIMIALISIVNMVNIISTGILNRRSELAAMQCVGMTKGQMYGMTIVECLQYVLTSGIVSSLASVGIIFAMDKFMTIMTLDEEFESIISYSTPLITVWCCVAAAFAAALITAFLSIQGLQKQTLVDQIRSVD